MEHKNLIVMKKKCFVWLCLSIFTVSAIISLCVAYFCTNYKFSISHMSTDAFIGAIATLMGILITFVLGFQIINALEINKKLHQFEESVEKKSKEKNKEINKKLHQFEKSVDKKNLEHNEKIKKNTEITNQKINKEIEDLKSKVTTELSQFNQDVDGRINKVENNVRNSIDNIDANLNQLSELGYRLEVESLDTRSVILIDRMKNEVDVSKLVKNLINIIFVIGKHNELAKRTSTEISWDNMEVALNLLQNNYIKVVHDINILGDTNKIDSLKKNIIYLTDSYNDYNKPYIKYINILMHIIEQNNNKDKNTLLIEVKAFIELHRKEIDDYIAKNL